MAVVVLLVAIAAVAAAGRLVVRVRREESVRRLPVWLATTALVVALIALVLAVLMVAGVWPAG